jgi:flagellar protein FlaG
MEIKNVVPPLGGSVQPAPLKNATQSESYVAEQARLKAVLENKPLESGQIGQSEKQKKGLDQAIAKVNEFLQAEQRTLSFSVNEATHDVVVEVRDAETDEVIRQIPPEFVVKLAERLHEMSADESVGVLLRDQA